MPMQRRLRREFLRRWIQRQLRATALRVKVPPRDRELHRLGSKPPASMVCGNDGHLRDRATDYDEILAADSLRSGRLQASLPVLSRFRNSGSTPSASKAGITGWT